MGASTTPKPQALLLIRISPREPLGYGAYEASTFSTSLADLGARTLGITTPSHFIVCGGNMIKGILGLLPLALLLASCGGTDDLHEDIGSSEQAIWYGDSAAANLAVVELYRNGGSYCTGFFITHRHIMTAAHCTDSLYSSQWYRVRIKTGYNSYAYLKDSGRNDNWVLMAEHTAPAWSFNNASAVGDTAILTLPSTTWSSVAANQQRLRISTAAPTVGQSLGIWGWGRRLPGDPGPAGDLLTGAGGAQIGVNGLTGAGTGVWFWAYAWNNARTCDGDSGGPATRFYGGHYIAVGDHGGPPAGYLPHCVEYGVRMDWATLHDKVTWIEDTLKLSYGSAFTCSRFANGANAYMKCF